MRIEPGPGVELEPDIYDQVATCYDNTTYSIVSCEMFSGDDFKTLSELNKAVIEHYKKAHPEVDISTILGFTPSGGNDD